VSERPYYLPPTRMTFYGAAAAVVAPRLTRNSLSGGGSPGCRGAGGGAGVG
jgi:hypothetical protein